jgi:hypothetical protein
MPIVSPELPIGDDRPFALARHYLRRTPAYTGYRYLVSRRGARREAALLAGVRTYCLFIGHGRSGHSIVGALLDAHRRVVIADELDPLRYLGRFSRAQILWLSVNVARDQARRRRQKRGREGKIYSYHVPDQWQGRADHPQVVGASNAGATVHGMAADPALLQRLRDEFAGMNLRFIHVARNPYDNIGTMMLRGRRTFDEAFDRYFGNWEKIERLTDRLDSNELTTVRHEALVTDPHAVLEDLCTFLGVDAPREYLDACAGILYSGPARSRHAVDWTPEQRRRIDARIGEFAGLAGYTFDG